MSGVVVGEEREGFDAEGASVPNKEGAIVVVLARLKAPSLSAE